METATEPTVAGPGSPTAEPTASMPAPQAQAEPVSPFEPLSDASVGEWAHYAGLDSRQVRYRIERVAAASVLTRVEVFENGKPLGLPTMREDLRNWDPVASLARGVQAERKAERVAVEAAGRSWQAVVYEDRWSEEGVAYIRRTWVSPEVPVFGTILMELFGDGVLEAKLELTACGQDIEAGSQTETETENASP